MSSESPTFAEETASNMLKELQSWWEIPSVAQYISLFREAFNLPEIEIEELENGLIEDTIKGPNEWLQNLVMAFLKTIMYGRVNANNWEIQLRKLIRRKWSESPFAEKENPFAEDKSFHELSLRSKVEVIYCFCLYRLDNNDITEVMKAMDAEALRVQKLGIDDAGNTYWYFYGTRLYKEEALEEKKTWDEEWKEQKRKSLSKKRGRGRPPKTPKKQNQENDTEETAKDDKFMNASGKSRWSVVCDTLEEWVNFTEKFKNSKSKNEKSLFQIIQENFLPTLNKLYEEKERKLQQKIKELLPVREKIVTRRETRKLRGDTGGDINYALLNGYDSDEDYKSYTDAYTAPPVVKDRAQRLEERNKRASEVGSYVPSRKRVRHDEENQDSPESSENSESGESDVMSQMIKLLTSIKLHKDAWPFLYPVNENEAPGYYEIIKDPVDLSLIEERLYKGEYETVGDLDEDFSKMVSNCELYNGESNDFPKMAQTLRILFRKEVAKVLESLETVESSNSNSDESNDSQYHSSSNSNSSSPPHQTSPADPESREHKKVKGKKKKKKNNTEALDLLAQASDMAVQDNYSNSPSPPQKKSPVPQETRPAPYQVPSKNLPCYAAAASSSGSSTNKITVPVSNSSFIPVISSSQGVIKNKPVIVRATICHMDKRSPPAENVATTSNKISSSPMQPTNINQSYVATTSSSVASNKISSSPMQPTNINQSFVATTSLSAASSNKISNSPMQTSTNISHPMQTSTNISQSFSKPKTVPVVISRPTVSQSDLRIQSNPMPAVTMQSNMCLPNGLPVLQQIVLPSGTQLPSGGQYIFTSPQNTIRILSKEQSVQLQNSGQLNQGFVKVMPQMMSPTMQVSKDAMQGLQFQTLSPNNTQGYAQVTNNPQYVTVPSYVVTNQNSITNSSPQTAVNFQSFQVSPRQMQINGQGNG